MSERQKAAIDAIRERYEEFARQTRDSLDTYESDPVFRALPYNVMEPIRESQRRMLADAERMIAKCRALEAEA